MAFTQAFIAELTNEAANTRKMLERIDAGQFDYKPHEKSMTFGRLANHIAELAGWITITVKTGGLDFAEPGNRSVYFATMDELLAIYDKNVAEALEALSATTDELLMQPWTLRNGDHVIFTLPKVTVIRSMCLNHIIHHRGQLSVYMRLNGVALPGIYGPTADEMAMMAAAREAAETAA